MPRPMLRSLAAFWALAAFGVAAATAAETPAARPPAEPVKSTAPESQAQSPPTNNAAEKSDGIEKSDGAEKSGRIEMPAIVIDGSDDTLLGKPVRSTKGDDLGRIVDVIVDRNGAIRAAIIDFGGFLGVGSRKIAVDWRALHFPKSGKLDKVIADLPQDDLRLAPLYKAGEPVVIVGKVAAMAPPMPKPAPAQTSTSAPSPTTPVPASTQPSPVAAPPTPGPVPARPTPSPPPPKNP